MELLATLGAFAAVVAIAVLIRSRSKGGGCCSGEGTDD